jgi:hypothetical protein
MVFVLCNIQTRHIINNVVSNSEILLWNKERERERDLSCRESMKRLCPRMAPHGQYKALE